MGKIGKNRRGTECVLLGAMWGHVPKVLNVQLDLPDSFGVKPTPVRDIVLTSEGWYRKTFLKNFQDNINKKNHYMYDMI